MKDLVAKLRIEAEATGEAKIAAMARELEQLAAQGTAAAPAFAELANELRTLQAEKGDALGGVSAQIDAVLNAATSAAPAVDGLSTALEGVAQPDGLADTAGQVGALGSAAAGAAPAVDGLSSALGEVAQQAGPTEAAGDLRDVGEAAQAAQAGLDTLAIDALATDIEQVGLDKLIAEFDRLAAQGGELAPQFAQAATELRGVQASAAGGAESVTQLGEEAAGAAGQVEGIGSAADALQTRLTQVASAVAGLFAVSALQGYAVDMIGVADAYGQMASRIEQVTGSTEEYELVQRRLLETAGATYRPLAEAQELYISTSGALKSLGYNTTQALDITDSFSYLLVSNAASADKASSAIDAYSKSIQSNKVDADSWSSIMAAMPSVVDAIATATGKSTEEIRALGVAGKLSLADLNEGLRQTVEANQAVAASMPTTVADALTALANSWAAYIGEANRASGITDKVAGAIEYVSENLEGLMRTAQQAGEVLLAIFSARALTAIKSYATTALLTSRVVDVVTTSTANQGAVAGSAAAKVATAASATAAHGVASRAAAGAVSAHAAATTAQATAAAQAAAATGAAAGRVTVLSGLLGALKFSGLAVGVSMLIEFVSKLVMAKSAAEEFEDAIDSAVGAADFSDADGINAFVEKLRALKLEAGEAGAELEAALGERLGARLRKLSEGELTALRARFAEAFADSGNSAKELEVALSAIDARLADIAKKQNWGRAFVTEAESARFALSALQQQFQAVGTEAAAVGAALKDMLADADLGSPDGIGQLLSDLKEVQASAYATGEQIDSALRERLASLTANELREFGIMAEMAFNQGKIGAAELARINEQVLAASFDQLGVNAAAALGKIGPAAQEAIAAVDNIAKGLAQAGVEAGQAGVAIEMALTKAFESVDSLPALEALLQKIQGLGAAGSIGAEGMARLGDAAAAARKRIEDMTPGIQSVDEAFRNLGVQSQAELKRLAAVAKQSFDYIKASGKATPDELAQAFKKYAEAAIEANDGVADAVLRGQAGQVGLRIEADETGKTVVRTMEESKKATEALAAATGDAADGMGDIAEASDAVADAQSSAASATDKLSNANVVATGTWMTAAGAASKYAGEAREAAWAIHQASNYTSDLTASFGAYVSGMEALDRQQNAINSNGARGLEDLKLRWLELNGTEEEIAAARHRRDEADMQRQIALMNIEIKRAARRGEDVSVLKDEIALMKEQLVWLDKIFKEEEKQRKAREAESEKEEKRRARERREAERERNKSGDESDSDSSPTPSRPSNTGGGNLGGTPNTNTGNRPAAPTGPIVNIHLGGVLDVNDPVTLDSLGRKLRPVFANLDRKGF